MANNYIEFSNNLKVDVGDAAWIRAKIDYFNNPPNKDSEGWGNFLAECEKYELDPADASGLRLKFSLSPDLDDVYLYSEGEYDWFHAAKLVQELFRARGRSNECWTLSWSESCSRPRVGEFGGGAVFVTAEKIEIFTTFEWLEAKAKVWEMMNG